MCSGSLFTTENAKSVNILQFADEPKNSAGRLGDAK